MKYSMRYRVAGFLRSLGVDFGAEKNDAVRKMRKTISDLPGKKIVFEIVLDKDGNWAAEAVNLDGLMTGGSIKDNMYEMITDAVFTYFNIAPKYCDDRLLIGGSTKKKNRKEIFEFVATPNLRKAVA